MIAMTAEERDIFLRDYFAQLERWRELDLALAEDMYGPGGPEMDDLQQQLAQMRDSYAQRLPSWPLARCPFSGQVLQQSIDIYGLDGLWWNYDAPVRPWEDLPATYLALDGAVSLGQPIAPAPFLCKPGAGVPGVLPRLLNTAGIKAVISTVPIGPHQGYPIAYFGVDVPAGLERVNTWGTGQYRFVDQHNMLRWGESMISLSDYDFDLGPWIERGQLLWIPPGDPTATLHSGTEGCPYLGLDGCRALQRIERGRVWAGETY